MPSNDISKPILEWYALHGRHNLPWQLPSLYHRWISEVMLQQTQVKTVIPYFERFIETFPNVEALAQAEEDEVLHLWTGLGYYTRARNIHRAAHIIMEQFSGKLPLTADEWQLLPGIGRSTAAAIIAQALDEPTAILDANVKRVIARYFGVYGSDSEAMNELWQLSESILPKNNGRDFAQAMMDIGATLCTSKNPRCAECPLQHNCYAFKHGVQDELPSKKPKAAIETREEHWVLLKDDSRVLLVKNNNLSGVWRGLWRLPSFAETPNIEDLQTLAQDLTNEGEHATIQHRFSHYALRARVHHWTGREKLNVGESDELLWYDAEKPANIGLPQPIKKLLHP